MNSAAFPIAVELPGWALCWARLAADPGGVRAAEVLSAAAARARARHGGGVSADHPTVAAIRRLFRDAGCDPTRYRPSSEALLRRVLRGEELPSIHPLVDLNNALSIELAIPGCIMAAGTIEPPVVMRAGLPGDEMESLRGPFSLAGKPLLADARGPFGTPITDSVRVKIQPETSDAWLVAYLPQGAVSRQEVESTLGQLADAAGIEVAEHFVVSG
jgi:DNA/RNA-binding domain of Phe-tRNA-synthetase-like protein